MKIKQLVLASALVAALTPFTAMSQTLQVDFQATIASEQNIYGGEARYFHVSTNPANPGTGVFAANDLSNNLGPAFVRNYDGPVWAYKFAGGTNNDITAISRQGGNSSAITYATSDTTFDGFGQNQAKIWTTSDPGSDIGVGGSDPFNVSPDTNANGWRSLGGAFCTVDVSDFGSTSGTPSTGSVHLYYGAFSAKPTVSVVMRDTDGPEPDITIANAHLNDDTANRTEYYVAEIDFDTNGQYDEIELKWDSDGDGDVATGNGRGIGMVVTSTVADTSAPTLAPADIVDDQSGGPFTSTGVDSITYTVTFSEFMDPDTIDASDFSVTGTASATIDSVVHFGGVTTVVVTPTAGTSGDLVLQVNAGAVLNDISDNALDTSSAIADSPAVTIVADVTPPTLVSITESTAGPILEGQTVVYTVTFDEPMKVSSIDTGDFENGGSPAGVIAAVNTTANPAVFEVLASSAYPGGVGTLILQIAMGAVLEDLSSNPLDTSSAIPDDVTITVNAQEDRETVTIGLPAASGENFSATLNVAYDASSSDKLVVIATKEGNSSPYSSLTYEGEPLTLAVGTGSDDGNRHWNGIYYLDDPGSFSDTTSPGIVAVSGSSRNIITAVGLSNTAPGVGGVAAPPAPDDSKTVDLAVDFVESMVIASHGMGQSGNTANVTSVNTDSPLIEMSAIETGNNWVGHVTGYANTQGPGLITYGFNGGSTTGVNTIAAEFPGAIGGAGGSAYDTWAGSNGLTEGVNDAQTDDADSGGQNNFYEFAFGGDPLNGNDDGALMHAFTADADGDSDLDAVLTVLVRDGGTWTYSGPAATATIDGVNYSIAGSATIPVSGAVNVLEGTTVITTGLPAAPGGYEYKSFILDGSVDEGLGEGYFQATVAPE